MTNKKLGYVTVMEADGLISQTLSVDDRRHSLWQQLSETDKAVWLNRALWAIEVQRFGGRKLLDRQKYAFPRDIGNVDNMEQAPGIPEAVKMAQVAEAATLAVEGRADDKRQGLRLGGVTAFSAGSITERLSPNGIYSGKLLSAEARMLLKPFMTGVAAIV